MGSGSRSLQGKCWFVSTLGILCFFTPAHLPCSSLLQGTILLLKNIPSGLEMELSWWCGCFKCSNVLDLIPSMTQTGQGGTLQNSGSGDRGIRSSSHPWLQSEFKTSLGYIRSCCFFFFCNIFIWQCLWFGNKAFWVPPLSQCQNKTFQVLITLAWGFGRREHLVILPKNADYTVLSYFLFKFSSWQSF